MVVKLESVSLSLAVTVPIRYPGAAFSDTVKLRRLTKNGALLTSLISTLTSIGVCPTLF